MSKIICIYQIINTVNNKSYIGSTIDLQKRIGSHLRALKSNKHHSILLQRAFNKYKEESFIYKILELISNQDNLKSLEQKYLIKYKPEYNISIHTGSVMYGRKHNKETIEKFKNKITPTGKDHPFYGRKLPESTKIKMGLKRKGRKHTEETKKKMSETSKRLNRFDDIKKHIEESKRKIIDSNGNIFNSLRETAKFWSIATQTVCDILKGRHLKTRKGISFKYYE